MIDLSMLGLKAFEPKDLFSLNGLNGNFEAIDGFLKELTTNKWDGKNRWRTYQWAINQTEAGFGYTEGGYFNLQYADSYSLGNDGVLSLVNPISVSNRTGLPPAGTYIKVQVVEPWGTPREWSTVMYVTDKVKSSSHSWTGDGGANVQTDISITGLIAYTTYERFSGMADSEAGDTFPVDGWVGGTHYVKAPAATVLRPMVEYGSYVGTGLMGSGNPTVLSFGIKPYLVYISAATKSRDSFQDYYNLGLDSGDGANHELFLRGVTKRRMKYYKGNGTDQYENYVWWELEEALVSTWSDYSLSFYRDVAFLAGNHNPGMQGKESKQLNEAGETYHYIAIGLAE